MADLKDIVAFLDRELNHAGIEDYPGALNGLQLDHEGRVERVIAAVDASLPVIERAAEQGRGSLLLVHHGMFWQGAQTITGPVHRKLKVAMEADMAIYSSHLPLDVHPEWGNNALLAASLGLSDTQAFMDFKGLAVGIQGAWSGSRDELKSALEGILEGPVHLCPGGSAKIGRVGVVTGGAGGEVAQAAAAGVDAFVTGEGPHHSYCLAEELGLNVFYGGHYATETFGVKALAEKVGAKFGRPWSFLDHPTGM
ncbi:MAG: Nif3-like dinuclear metal center hexameric protein [Akkermansiaceae bacterium]|nr:Nif3-like dinuclear metal center hexameric protein [Akkermansiaceae bacterium]